MTRSDDPCPNGGVENLTHKSKSKYHIKYLLIGLLFLSTALITFGVISGNKDRQNSPNGQNAGLFPSIFSAPPTPQASRRLSKEYIYAGPKLVAVQDSDASPIPPADLAVWRPSNGYWYVKGGPGSTETYYGWGMAGDLTAPGDYDGDGKTDFAIYRPGSPGVWWITRSSDNTYYSVTYGTASDKPVPADYDGDSKTDIALFRPSNNNWYVMRSSNQAYIGYVWGSSGDLPIAADFDGDGKADPTVWRDSERSFHTLRSLDSSPHTQGMQSTPTNKAVVGDYDGDSKADYAVVHGDEWLIVKSSDNSSYSLTWQDATDIPVPNDYDGDGKCDIAVWRPSGKGVGTWYILNSADSSTREDVWGTTGDIPVPALYRR